jgi:cytochrome c-type biogenesis protein
MLRSKRFELFLCSLFFVIGFAFVFSVLGILLQTALVHVATSVQMWLSRIGGLVIIGFGLFLVGLIHIPFLERDHKLRVMHKFNSRYVTSFVFGAAFAVGWSPCVGAALGAILVLASTSPGSAFALLFAYTLGVGVPFLVVGAFAEAAQKFIDKAGEKLSWFKYIFGALLIIIGIFMFVGELSSIANLPFLAEFLGRLGLVSGGDAVMSFSLWALGVSFLAGLGSFLSPCILPLVPGFLSYLAAVGTVRPTVSTAQNTSAPVNSSNQNEQK